MSNQDTTVEFFFFRDTGEDRATRPSRFGLQVLVWHSPNPEYIPPARRDKFFESSVELTGFVMGNPRTDKFKKEVNQQEHP